MKKILTLIYLLTLNTLVFGQTQDWFSDIIVCEDTTIAFPSNITSDSTFVWFFENNPITNNSDSSITISESGMYSLYVYNTSDTLNDSILVVVDVIDPDFMLTLTDSDINVDSLVNICIEDNPTLTTPNSLENYTHFWHLDGSPVGADTLSGSTLTIEDIIDDVNFNQEHEYHVEIENACGIYPSKNIVTMVINECNCALDMPNIFSPNGDSENDLFKPLNNHELETEAERICESTDFTMTVFNQWGKHMATVKSKDEYPSWNGLNKGGNEVPTGVYFYNIVYEVNIYTLPTQKEITGYVHLYR